MKLDSAFAGMTILVTVMRGAFHAYFILTLD
jgi:hypothetical protein